MFLLVEWNDSSRQHSVINGNRVRKVRIDGKEVEAFVSADCIPAVEVYVQRYRSTSYWATIISTGDKDNLDLQLENVALHGEVAIRGLKRPGHSRVSKQKAVAPTSLSMDFNAQLKKSLQRSRDQTLLSDPSMDSCEAIQAVMSSPVRQGKRRRDPIDHRRKMAESRRELNLLADKLRKILITAGFERGMVKSRRQIDEACCEILEKFKEEFKKAIPEYVLTRTCTSKRHSKYTIRPPGLPTMLEAFTTAQSSPPRSRLASTSLVNSNKSSNRQQIVGIDCSPNSLTEEDADQESITQSRDVFNYHPAKIQSPPGGNPSIATSSAPAMHGTRSHIDTGTTRRGSVVRTPVGPIPAYNRHIVRLEPCHYTGQPHEQANDVLLHTEPRSFTEIPHCKATVPVIHSFPSTLPFAHNADALEPQYSSIASVTRYNNTSDLGHTTTTNECTAACDITHPKQLIDPLLFEAPDNPPWSKAEVNLADTSHHHINGSYVCSSRRRLRTSVHTEFVQDDRAGMTLASEATPLNASNSCQLNKLPFQRPQKAQPARWEIMSRRYEATSAYCGHSDDAQKHFAVESCNAVTYAPHFHPRGSFNNGIPETTAQFASSGRFGTSPSASSSASITGLTTNQFPQDYGPMVDDGAAVFTSSASGCRLEGSPTHMIATLRAAVGGDAINGGRNGSNGSNNNSNHGNISFNNCRDDRNCMINNSNGGIHNNNNNSDINKNSQSFEAVQPAATCHTGSDERATTTFGGSEAYAFFNALPPKAIIMHDNLAHGDQCSDMGASGGAVVSDVLAGADEAAHIPPTSLQSCIATAAEGCRSYGTTILSQTATVLQKAIIENDLYKKYRCSLLIEGHPTRKGNSTIASRIQPEQAWCALEGNGNGPANIFTCL